MKFRSTLFTGVLAAILALPAFANDEPMAAPSLTKISQQTQVESEPKTEVVTAALPQFTAADAQMLFEQNAEPMQLATLSQQEMMETEGAIAPVVVYGLMVGGRVAYVGITNNLARRTAQHAANKAFTSVRTFGTSPTRTGARVMEQNHINRYNTINNGWNRINSISPRNPLSRQVSVPYRR